MNQVKYLVLGGGISGLAFASAAGGKDCLVLEKDDEAGGYCRTKFSGEYVWDYAGHFFHFNTERWKNFFLDHVDPAELVRRNKCTHIQYRGTYIDYPFQMNIHELPKDEFIDCLYDLFHKTEKESYESFLDMLYGKFGKAIVEKFLRPYNEKLYAVDLTTLDQNAMGRFFPYANKEQIIDNMKGPGNHSYNDTFLYPKRGAGFFVDLLKSSLPEGTVRMNAEAVKVDLAEKTVTLSSGERISYEYLINTTPLNRFLPSLGRPECEALASRLSYNKVLVFNLGFDCPACLTEDHWLYIPDRNVNYYRVGFYNNILGRQNASLYVEIGYGRDAAVDVDGQLKATLQNLTATGIVPQEAHLVDHQANLMDPAYVHINTETDRQIQEALRKLAADGVYSIGRYGAWTYCSMEDCMVMASDLYQSLLVR